jgi:hypothetical protein
MSRAPRARRSGGNSTFEEVSMTKTMRVMGWSSSVSTVALLASSASAEVAAEPGVQEHSHSEAAESSGELRTARNVLYAELGGNGFAYTLNYERFVNDDVALRAGVGFISASTPNAGGGSASAGVYWAPLMVNYLGIGGRSSKLELGVGVVPFYFSASVSDGFVKDSASGVHLVGTASIAYRYVPPEGGFNFKVGVAPLFSSAFGMLAIPGLAFGMAF